MSQNNLTKIFKNKHRSMVNNLRKPKRNVKLVDLNNSMNIDTELINVSIGAISTIAKNLLPGVLISSSSESLFEYELLVKIDEDCKVGQSVRIIYDLVDASTYSKIYNMHKSQILFAAGASSNKASFRFCVNDWNMRKMDMYRIAVTIIGDITVTVYSGTIIIIKNCQ